MLIFIALDNFKVDNSVFRFLDIKVYAEQWECILKLGSFQDSGLVQGRCAAVVKNTM